MTRSLAGAMIALLLALRLLAPPGFMPAFEHGSMTIVVCPDGDLRGLTPASHHHHPGQGKTSHAPCPYAAASALGSLAVDLPPFASLIVLGAILLLGRAFQFLEHRRANERPPSRGPPLPA